MAGISNCLCINSTFCTIQPSTLPVTSMNSTTEDKLTSQCTICLFVCLFVTGTSTESDVCLAHSWSNNTVHAAASEAGYAAKKRGDKKHSKYSIGKK